MSQGSWSSDARERWRRYRRWYIGSLILAFAIICAGVIAGNSSDNSSSQPGAFNEHMQQQSPMPSRRHMSSPPAKPEHRHHHQAKPSLTGLGAPLSVFEAHFPQAAAPLTEHGRVYGFETYYVEPPISEGEATAIASSAMPPDAILISETEKPTCEQVDFRSATLGSLFGAPKVMAEFSSGPNSGDPYSPSDITNILFLSYFGPIGC
jgi:hypothetical protein